MAVTDLTDFTDQISVEMGTLASKVADDAFDQASDKTLAELQWAYPITDSFKSYWTIERGKRHILQIFLIQSADKFKYKQINLNQRFDHYLALLKKMDEDFLHAVEENPESFPAAAGGISFPDYIANTFTYNILGRSLGT